MDVLQRWCEELDRVLDTLTSGDGAQAQEDGERLLAEMQEWAEKIGPIHFKT